MQAPKVVWAFPRILRVIQLVTELTDNEWWTAWLSAMHRVVFRPRSVFVVTGSGNMVSAIPRCLPCRVKFRSVLGGRFGMILVCGFLQPVWLGIRASCHPSKV